MSYLNEVLCNFLLADISATIEINMINALPKPVNYEMYEQLVFIREKLIRCLTRCKKNHPSLHPMKIEIWVSKESPCLSDYCGESLGSNMFYFMNKMGLIITKRGYHTPSLQSSMGLLFTHFHTKPLELSRSKFGIRLFGRLDAIENRKQHEKISTYTFNNKLVHRYAGTPCLLESCKYTTY